MKNRRFNFHLHLLWCFFLLKKYTLKFWGNFYGGPGIKTLHVHCEGLGFDPQGSKIKKKIFDLYSFHFAWENFPTFLAEHIYKQYFPLVFTCLRKSLFLFILKDNLSGDRILSWSYCFLFLFFFCPLVFVIQYFKIFHSTRLGCTISDGNSAVILIFVPLEVRFFHPLWLHSKFLFIFGFL